MTNGAGDPVIVFGNVARDIVVRLSTPRRQVAWGTASVLWESSLPGPGFPPPAPP